MFTANILCARVNERVRVRAHVRVCMRVHGRVRERAHVLERARLRLRLCL